MSDTAKKNEEQKQALGAILLKYPAATRQAFMDILNFEQESIGVSASARKAKVLEIIKEAAKK